MKEIKAVIRQEKAQMVLDFLEKAGAANVTLTHVMATGIDSQSCNCQMNMEFGRNIASMIKIELICSDCKDLQFVELIRNAAFTDSPGDGIITVRNINRVLKIRTSGEGIEAL